MKKVILSVLSGVSRIYRKRGINCLWCEGSNCPQDEKLHLIQSTKKKESHLGLEQRRGIIRAALGRQCWYQLVMWVGVGRYIHGTV